MPLLRAWNSDPYSLAAIWQIGEPEDFFVRETGLTLPDIKSEKRRIERLAGRFLLKHLQSDFPLHGILPDGEDKPRVPDNRYFFSISHSWPYVAAVISPYAEAGIDIQCWRPRMQTLRHKFLSQEEQLLVGDDDKRITLAWCAKEAAYKWQGRRGVEFSEHLALTRFATEADAALSPGSAAVFRGNMPEDHLPGTTAFHMLPPHVAGLPSGYEENAGHFFDIEINLKLSNPEKLLLLYGIVNEYFAFSIVRNNTQFLNLELT